MHAVVTGGGGFIGSAIVRRLIRESWRVTVLGRSRYPALERLGVRCLRGDIADGSFVAQACRNADVVFHVAAKAGVWGKLREYERANVRGTLNCIRACRENSVPALVYTSTPSVVFDGRDINGGDESLAYARRPLCHYAATKIIAEQHVLAANGPDLKTVAIRPHLVWGPGDPHLLPRLFARARSGRLKIIGNGQNRVDIAYIDNVVEAHILAAENLHESTTAAGQAFFIGQEEPVYLWQWINTLLARAGLSPIEKKISYQTAYLVGLALEGAYRLVRTSREPPMTRFVAQQLARSHWFNHGKAKKVLGFRDVVSISEGMDHFFSVWREGKE
jgi:nucleoside-diphosphate-sugar epimerase